MAAPATAEASTVTYEELADLEADFDDFDVELLRNQARQERALYTRRAQLVRRIPHFWPLVLEQAPPEIDQYIQPTDAAVLLSALEDLEVTRFEVGEDSAKENNEASDPRSLAIRFTFAPNDYFEDRVLEKRFWHRRARGGRGAWSGLVSQPVPIKWKKGKDLTGGLLGLASETWEGETREGEDTKETKQEALQKELDRTSVGALSFFAWFGYVGRRIDADTSRAAVAEERAQRAARQAKRANANGANGSKESKESKGEDEEDTDDDDDDDEEGAEEYPLEIFPDGDTLAVTLAEDLWPNAIRYFRQAQEQDDAASDDDFESGSEDNDRPEPPQKKQKT